MCAVRQLEKCASVDYKTKTMRLKLYYEFDKDAPISVDEAKKVIVADLSKSHLFGMIKEVSFEWNNSVRRCLKADFFVVTSEQFHEIMENLDYDKAKMVKEIMSRDIPELNVHA